MNRNILSSLFVIVTIVTVGCAPRKVIDSPVIAPVPAPVVTPAPVQPKPSRSEIEALQRSDVTYNTLSLKGKAKLNIDGDQNNVNINIRIKDKEMIWVSVSAIIGEVARVLITPDSIKIINRLQTTYTRKPFKFIHQYTNKQITFPVLQSIMSGNSIPQFINETAKVTASGQNKAISGTLGLLIYKFIFTPQPRLQQTELNDPSMGQAVNVFYGDHKQFNGMLFPGKIDLNSVAGADRIAIQMEFSAIEGNVTLQYPFTVNSRFKVIN